MLDASWNANYWEQTIKDLDFDESPMNVGGVSYAFGAEDFQNRVLEMLKENFEAHKRNSQNIYDDLDWKDSVLIAKEYEDLISIVENLKVENKYE